MNVQPLFCINYGRDSKPDRTDELQIDDDECAEGRREKESEKQRNRPRRHVSEGDLVP